MIPTYADIALAMRPGGELSALVQRMLDEAEPWKRGDNPIEECQFGGQHILPSTVPVPKGSVPLWGIHKDHTDEFPGISPFVDSEPDPESVGWITLELSGSSMFPLLVRAYGGNYTPGLPWMSNVQKNRQVIASRHYWKQHAYLGTRLIKDGEIYSNPPRWYATK
jgi:hypothetical protein